MSISGNITDIKYKFNGVYALTRSVNRDKNENPADESFGKQLPFIPVHSGNCMLEILYKSWKINYLWNYYSERYTTTTNSLNSWRDHLYPYFMNHIGLGRFFEFKKVRLDVDFNLHNLFNEKYRSVLNRPMPGINYNLQLKLTFKG